MLRLRYTTGIRRSEQNNEQEKLKTKLHIFGGEKKKGGAKSPSVCSKSPIQNLLKFDKCECLCLSACVFVFVRMHFHVTVIEG